MDISFFAPIIFVKDIEKAKRFYTEVLEQKIEHDFGKNIIFKSRVSLWEIDPDLEIASVKGNSANGNTFELYFETKDISGTFSSLSKYGIKFLHKIKTEPWGQMTFRFFDPDNHLIEIGENMPTFVSRIYRETGSVQSVVQKTGVAEQVVKNILQTEI